VNYQIVSLLADDPFRDVPAHVARKMDTDLWELRIWISEPDSREIAREVGSLSPTRERDIFRVHGDRDETNAWFKRERPTANYKWLDHMTVSFADTATRTAFESILDWRVLHALVADGADR
jgi:hypothetical protein